MTKREGKERKRGDPRDPRLPQHAHASCLWHSTGTATSTTSGGEETDARDEGKAKPRTGGKGAGCSRSGTERETDPHPLHSGGGARRAGRDTSVGRTAVTGLEAGAFHGVAASNDALANRSGQRRQHKQWREPRNASTNRSKDAEGAETTLGWISARPWAAPGQ